MDAAEFSMVSMHIIALLGMLAQLSYNLLRLVNQGIGEVCPCDVSSSKISPTQQRMLSLHVKHPTDCNRLSWHSAV